ncbi:MAG: hypothetical protein AAGI23_16875 [Bacteroidota bacterium]
MKRSLLFSFLYLISFALLAQHSSSSIPFELTDQNNIVVKAVLNQQDTVQLMFHTAASDMTLISSSTEHIKSIIWKAGDEVESWGGRHQTRYSGNNVLSISELTWDNLSIWENERSGPSTDGKFGIDLFDGRIIDIDFDQQIIALHDTLPEKADSYERRTLRTQDDFLFLSASSQTDTATYPHQFLIHSGYGGGLLYDDEFIAKNKLGQQLEITSKQILKDSYGNEIVTKKAILPSLTIGEVILTDVPVGFFEGSIGRQKVSVIGGELLKRFNIIVDAEHRFIYLKANTLTVAPYTN